MRIDDHSQRLPGRRLSLVAAPRACAAILLLLLAAPLLFAGCERRQITSPRIGEAASAGAPKSTHPPTWEGGEAGAGAAANRAVGVEVTRVDEQPGLSAAGAPGRSWLIVETRWRNLLPRQQVSRSALEGRVDRTMGVGALTGGGGDAEELVEVDVAYRVPRWIDHVYLLADGVAYPLDGRSEEIPGGVAPAAPLELPAHGDVVDASLLFLAPGEAKNLALRLFDYSHGHVTVPIRGRQRRAVGDGRPPRHARGEAASEDLQLATVGVDFRPQYLGRPAPEGRVWAIVGLLGRSLSSGNIVEIEPRGYLWLEIDGGYLRYAEPRERLRFTPEVFQHQEVAFALPAEAERLALGARVRNEVLRLALSERSPAGLPEPVGRHADPGVMEVLLFGSRRQGDLVVLDLGVRPLAEARGLEIQAAAQFLLQAGAAEARLDSRATAALAHPPPEPFVVPPGTPVRFELAYRTRNTPDALRIRGFASEGRIEL